MTASTAPAGLAPAVRAALAFDRKVLVERGRRRARDRSAPCSATTTRWRRCPARSSSTTRTASIRTTPSTSIRRRRAGRSRPISRPRPPARVQALAVADLPRARAGGPGARRLLPRARRRRALRQRGEHHPRLHRDLDVPEDVGGLGPVPERTLSDSPRRRWRLQRWSGPSRHLIQGRDKRPRPASEEPFKEFLFSVYPAGAESYIGRGTRNWCNESEASGVRQKRSPSAPSWSICCSSSRICDRWRSSGAPGRPATKAARAPSTR